MPAAVSLARERLRPPVYVTLDIDVLDPAFAPETGTPEAGGLTSRELIAILRGLAGAIDVVAAKGVATRVTTNMWRYASVASLSPD